MSNILVIVIAGPTASGKSALAVQLALWLGKTTQRKSLGIHGAEVISADSRQVYKGLDIGSGKITKKEMMGVPHHLIDIANPKHTFSVAEYQNLAHDKLTKIIKQNKTPIICGGTGLYIDTLLKNQSLPKVPPNLALRKELKTKTTQELFSLLSEKDPERAKTIDPKNPVRLIRALEIIRALHKVPSIQTQPLPYKVLYFCLTHNPEELRNRINKRLTQRLKTGMIKEVKQLHKKGLSWKRLESLGLEYRYVAQLLQKKITKEEMIETLQKEIWLYAKRQLTWFRKNKEAQWISDFNQIKEILMTDLSSGKQRIRTE